MPLTNCVWVFTAHYAYIKLGDAICTMHCNSLKSTLEQQDRPRSKCITVFEDAIKPEINKYNVGLPNQTLTYVHMQ